CAANGTPAQNSSADLRSFTIALATIDSATEPLSPQQCKAWFGLSVNAQCRCSCPRGTIEDRDERVHFLKKYLRLFCKPLAFSTSVSAVASQWRCKFLRRYNLLWLLPALIPPIPATVGCTARVEFLLLVLSLMLAKFNRAQLMSMFVNSPWSPEGQFSLRRLSELQPDAMGN